MHGTSNTASIYLADDTTHCMITLVGVGLAFAAWPFNGALSHLCTTKNTACPLRATFEHFPKSRGLCWSGDGRKKHLKSVTDLRCVYIYSRNRDTRSSSADGEFAARPADGLVLRRRHRKQNAICPLVLFRVLVSSWTHAPVRWTSWT